MLLNLKREVTYKEISKVIELNKKFKLNLENVHIRLSDIVLTL